jgi:hypothetical protein
VLALAVTVGRGRSPLALLGAYRAATGSGYSIGEVARYVLWHAAEIDLYLGIVGFAALLALWFAPRAASAPARAFAAATLPTCVFLIVEVGAFASRQSFRVEERNGFYIAPLALIALLGLTVDGVVPRVRRAVVAAALVAGVLPFAIPLGRLVNTSIVSDTLALLPWWWLQDRGISFASLRYVELLVGLAAGAAFLLVPRRLAFVFVAATAVYFVAVTFVAENGRHGMHQASVGGLWAGTRVANYDWIDRRVGRTARVAFLWHYAGETRPLWNNEFFNRSIGRVYTVDGPDPADGGLPEVPVRERADGVLATGTGAVPRVSYAVSYTDIAGRQIGRDPRIGLGLYRVDGPLVILTRVRGLFADDTWGRREVTYRRLRCLPGTLAVRLGTDSQLFDRAQVVTAREGGAVVGRARVEPTAQPTMRVPLRPGRGGTCTVLFTAAGVRVPARVQPGSKDARPLAVHYYAFDYARR